MTVIRDVLYKDLESGRRMWVGTSFIDGKTWILHTDYGTVSYAWSSIGNQTLKSFLAEKNRGTFDLDYLLRKLWREPNQRTEIDWPETRKALWKAMVEAIYEDKIFKDAVDWDKWREKLEHLKEADSFEEWHELPDDMQVSDPWEFIVEKMTDSATAFVENVLQPFCEMFHEQKHGKPKGLAVSHNGENYTSVDSREEAIDEHGIPGQILYIGKGVTVPIQDWVGHVSFADNIVECLDEALVEFVGESSEGAFGPGPTDITDLDERIQATVAEWIRERNLEPNCFMVEDVEEVQIPLAE